VRKFRLSSKKCPMVSLLLLKLTVDYNDLANKSNEAALLLSNITDMQAAITDLKNAQEQANTDQNLPLPASIDLLSTQKAARDQLAINLERKTQENTRKRREVEKLRVQLAEMDRNRVDAEMFAREAEKMKNAENLQAEMASKKQVGWWYVCYMRSVLSGRLKAMTATQMDFLGLKEFKYDDKAQEVRLVLQMVNVGDIPLLLQLKDHKLDSAKVYLTSDVLLI
jgi:hypothetical protein